MKLHVILFTLALLTFSSAFIGGLFYYSSLKDMVIQKATIESELSVSAYKDHISYLLSEKLRDVKALSKTTELIKALKDPINNNLLAANALLLYFNNSLESDVCYLMNSDGKTISSSNFEAPDSFVGKSYNFRPYFKKALKGSSTVYLALGVTSGKRGAYFSQPIYDGNGKMPIGILVLKTSVDALEKTLIDVGYSESIAIITTPQGIIFMSSLNSWLYHSLFKSDINSLAKIVASKQFGNGPWKWTGLQLKNDHQIVDGAGNEYLFHKIEIKALPGWTILSMINPEKISKETINPMINLSGYVIAVICFFIGVSVITLYRMAYSEILKRKQAEDALQKAKSELETKVEERTLDYKTAKEAAEKANMLKSEFLANISHELRTPMHGILNFSKFGIEKIDKTTKEKSLHYFQQIRLAGERLMDLLGNLLDLSKLEAGKETYHMQSEDTGLITKNIVFELRPLWKQQQLDLEALPPTIQTITICDKTKIAMVVRHLLTNAIKFTPPGGKITVSFTSEAITSKQKNISPEPIPALYICVQDNGIGIPENEKEFIFNKFIQSSRTKTGAGGTGLGLSICHKIIQAHNGKIWAENNSEGGASFIFSIPYPPRTPLIS